jgi:hypothetical protein
MSRKNGKIINIQRRNAGGDPVEVASSLDALYFKQHPNETTRIRPIIQGEFRDKNTEALHVKVTQIQPGCRTRAPVSWYAFEPGEDYVPSTKTAVE